MKEKFYKFDAYRLSDLYFVIAKNRESRKIAIFTYLPNNQETIVKEISTGWCLENTDGNLKKTCLNLFSSTKNDRFDVIDCMNGIEVFENFIANHNNYLIKGYWKSGQTLEDFCDFIVFRSNESFQKFYDEIRRGIKTNEKYCSQMEITSTDVLFTREF